MQAARPVRVVEGDVMDREAEGVELLEDLREPRRGAGTDYELPVVVRAVVEAPVRHGQKAEPGERHGTTGMPGRPPDLGPYRRRQRPDRDMERMERDERERRGQNAH